MKKLKLNIVDAKAYSQQNKWKLLCNFPRHCWHCEFYPPFFSTPTPANSHLESAVSSDHPYHQSAFGSKCWRAKKYWHKWMHSSTQEAIFRWIVDKKQRPAREITFPMQLFCQAPLLHSRSRRNWKEPENLGKNHQCKFTVRYNQAINRTISLWTGNSIKQSSA